MSKPIKRLRVIKKMYSYFVKNYRELEPQLMLCEKDDFNLIEKNLRALDIIKNINLINVYEDMGGTYHLETKVDEIKLNKADYDLLKEIFG